jgi:hypothetical protein
VGVVSPCEEDEDSDMPPRKRTKTGESIEQSSAIDSGSKSPAMASVVCGGGARSGLNPKPHNHTWNNKSLAAAAAAAAAVATAGAAVEPGFQGKKLRLVRRVRSTAQDSPKNVGMLGVAVWTYTTT